MITPNMPANMAIKIILLHQLERMEYYAKRIPSDTDIEDVHKFRVAVRRTRSAINQLGFVFKKKSLKGFKKDFSYITKFSNPLRDLDVLLAKEEYYKSLLNIMFLSDIQPVFEHIRYLRSMHFDTIERRLSNRKNNRFVNVVRRWRRFLNNDKHINDTPIKVIGEKRIRKQYKKIIKGELKDLHQLRIEFKKLRYLSEFFKEIFPTKELIKKIKPIQDDLGEYNDCCVHQLLLSEIAKELEQYLSTGSLIGKLEDLKIKAEHRFLNKYGLFNW